MNNKKKISISIKILVFLALLKKILQTKSKLKNWMYPLLENMLFLAFIK